MQASLHWSTLVQIASTLVIAIYFAVRALSVRRPELHAWVIAWPANLAALAISIGLAQSQPNSAALFAIGSTAYFFCKTQFVVLLVDGASGFAVMQPREVPHGRRSMAVAILSALAGMIVGSLDRVGMVQSVTIGAILLAGAIAVSRQNAPAWRWLATGFVLRTMLAAAETSGYAFHSIFVDRRLPPSFDRFMTVHAAFDAGAEWIIALGCAFMLHERIRQEATSNPTRSLV